MKTGIIVQARTTSSRLPNKVLLPLPSNGDVTVLDQVVNRVKKCTQIDDVIIATTQNKTDDPIEKKAEELEVKCFRGDEQNVLNRYYKAAVEYDLDIIVRITSDCPFIDPFVIDDMIIVFKNSNTDYLSSALNRSFPHGLDAEVFNFKSLEKAHLEASEKPALEHVTYYFYSNPDTFICQNFEATANKTGKDIRITIDTKEDYMLLCAIHDYLKDEEFITTEMIIDLYNNKPWIRLINGNIKQKKVFETTKEELIEAAKILELQDLNKATIAIRKLIEEYEQKLA